MYQVNNNLNRDLRANVNQAELGDEAEYALRDNRNSGRYMNEDFISRQSEMNSFNEDQNQADSNNNTGYLEPQSLTNNEAIIVDQQANLEQGKIVENKPELTKSNDTILYFQPKVRNWGFWGRTKLRNGTWLVIVSLILFAISITLIGVFWGLWYGHAVNYPLRVVAITLLCASFICFICGMLSNYLMTLNSKFKYFLGSPIRKCSYVLLSALLMLITASALMATYYTYWHNRWVNTPLIIISIVFFVVGGIMFYFSMRHNFIQFFLHRYEMYETSAEPRQFQQRSIYNNKLLEQRHLRAQQIAERNRLSQQSGQRKSNSFRKKLTVIKSRPFSDPMPLNSTYDEEQFQSLQ